MKTKKMGHLEICRPSILRIAQICQECMEHNRSWYEFKDRIVATIQQEDKMIKMLSETIRK